MASDGALEAQVRQALVGVEEPELRRPLTELGMVHGMAVDGATVVVHLAAPLPGDSSRAEIRHRVVAAVGAVPGVERVDVEIRAMNPDEVVACARVLTGEAPPNPLQVVDASAALSDDHGHATARPNPFTDSRTRVIAVSSGKGGVGKSSVTTNLAVSLAARGHAVAAVDADVWGFSMPRMLGISAPPGLIDDLPTPPLPDDTASTRVRESVNGLGRAGPCP